VPKVEVASVTDDTQCRNERPTGSRIAIRRCSAKIAAGGGKRENDTLRRDIEEMRLRQQQLARDAAAIRRR
jgi:hypothetical protein